MKITAALINKWNNGISSPVYITPFPIFFCRCQPLHKRTCMVKGKADNGSAIVINKTIAPFTIYHSKPAVETIGTVINKRYNFRPCFINRSIFSVVCYAGKTI